MDIYAECHYLDPKTLKPAGGVKKTFTNIGEFNSWYRVAKTDTHCIIKVMRYNPNEDPAKKRYLDEMILGLSSRYET